MLPDHVKYEVAHFPGADTLEKAMLEVGSSGSGAQLTVLRGVR